MKNLKYFTGFVIIIIFTLGSCKKWPDPGEGQGDDSKLMENLVVAQDFDWKTTKTVSISIKLPDNDPNEVVRIYTEDLEELLYIGYGDETSHEVNTRITAATYLSTAVIYYGYNDRYVPVLLGFDKTLDYDYNLDLGLKSLKDDCGCEGRLKTLTMQYNGSSTKLISVYENKNNKLIFEGNIQPGASFSFTGSKSNGDMDKKIHFYIGNSYNTTIQVDCKYNLYKGDTFGKFTIVTGTSEDELELCDESEVCGCEGGLVTLKLRYVGISEANVKVISKQGRRWITSYEGDVEPNEEFSFTGERRDGRLNNTLYLYVNNNENTSIHTSCSDDIEIGDTYGLFRIVEGYNKNNLSLCGSIDPVDNGGGGNQGGGNNGGGNDGNTTISKVDGTLAFEDLWPSKGDYDFNDLVVSYDFVVTKDNQDRVMSISSTFKVYAFGASFHNAFGFQFPNVNNNQIISVSGSDIASGNSVFSIASNGLEEGQSKATVIVYDDSYRIMTHPGEGIGVNTVQNAPYVTPVEIVIDILFYSNGSFAQGGAVTYSDLDIGNFNPFIVVNETRGREVHLPNKTPTSLAASSFFGTFNDDSDAAANRYYKSENNLPWAINIPDVFEYPYEKREIVYAYLKFAEWAENSGTVFDDWYKDIAGYRNSTFIYNPN